MRGCAVVYVCVRARVFDEDPALSALLMPVCRASCSRVYVCTRTGAGCTAVRKPMGVVQVVVGGGGRRLLCWS